MEEKRLNDIIKVKKLTIIGEQEEDVRCEQGYSEKG